MRVFVAGATGVLGSRIIPLLTAAGHTVAGMTRSREKAPLLEGAGADPVVCDVYDVDRLVEVVEGFRPDVVMHQLTDLPDDAAALPRYRDANARIRRVGTTNLLTAARLAGATTFLAQSVAWPLPGDGGAAVAFLESSVLAAGGVVLRYGQLYGAGTYYPQQLPPDPRVHVDTAAAATVAAMGLHPQVLEILDE